MIVFNYKNLTDNIEIITNYVQGKQIRKYLLLINLYSLKNRNTLIIISENDCSKGIKVTSKNAKQLLKITRNIL